MYNFICVHVKQGMLKEEEVDGFNIPQYRPSASEVEVEIVKEGSFRMNRIEVSKVNWSGRDDDECYWNPKEWEYSESEAAIRVIEGGCRMAKCMRAVAEPMLTSHFGESIIEPLFDHYQQILTDCMSNEKTYFFNVTVSLTRKIRTKLSKLIISFHIL